MLSRLKKNKKLMVLLVIMCVLFGVTFTLGITSNPNFNIHDFCMNLASEILGIVIALVLVEAYVSERKKARKSSETATEEGK